MKEINRFITCIKVAMKKNYCSTCNNNEILSAHSLWEIKHFLTIGGPIIKLIKPVSAEAYVLVLSREWGFRAFLHTI